MNPKEGKGKEKDFVEPKLTKKIKGIIVDPKVKSDHRRDVLKVLTPQKPKVKIVTRSKTNHPPTVEMKGSSSKKRLTSSH